MAVLEKTNTATPSVAQATGTPVKTTETKLEPWQQQRVDEWSQQSVSSLEPWKLQRLQEWGVIKAPTPATTNIEQKAIQDLTNPTLPTGATFTPTAQTVQQGEMISPTAGQISSSGTVQGQTISAPAAVTPTQGVATTVGAETPVVDAVQGTVSAQAQVTAAQGQESQEFQDAIQQARDDIINYPVNPMASVQEQYKKLMSDVEAGTPAWAAAAVRAANQTLAARGLGASSIAAEGITSALMQAALPIAVKDAELVATMDLEKFSQTAAIGMLRASHIANLDITNLNNRQQAAVENAKAFLSMDLTNVENAQQTAIVNSQNRLQTLLSDQAAQNYMEQFNIANEFEADKFFSEMAQRTKEFNASMTQDATKFNATMEQQRKMFNATNQLQIEQSNVDYLRRINTANTANENQANLINTQNTLDISNTAMANLFQLMRDREAYIFQASENQEDRDIRRAIAELQSNTNLKLQSNSQKAKNAEAIGGVVSDVVSGILGKIF